MDPQRSWSCSKPSHWSCAPSRRCQEVSSCTWFQKPGSFFSVSKQGPWFTPVRMELTRDLYSLYLSAKLVVLHCQILFSLAIAATAKAILIQTSACCSQVLETGHFLLNFWPFMLISALMLSMLLVMIFLFPVPTSIPYAAAVSTSRLVRSRSSSLLLPIRLVLSANHR